MLSIVQAAQIYYTNRTFTAVTFNLTGTPPADMLNSESKKLTEMVQGSQVKTNDCYAIEKQAAIAICYGSDVGAWDAVMAYNGTPSNYPGKIFDNVGWVRGLFNTGTPGWAAYLWVLQNRIAFQSSTSDWWQTTNGIPVAITNVMVGSMGDYQALSNVVDIGPSIPTNYPGANQYDLGEYHVDITNVYYQLSIPDIWITPRTAVACVGGSNVQYTVAGSNIPNGVTWAIIPDGLTSGAVIQASNDWHYAGVMPGYVGTNYKVRATSVDATNFYDEVGLSVLKVELNVEGSDETDEITVGGFIPINADNDNGSIVSNGYAQTNDLAVNPVAGEDDLKTITLVLEPNTLSSGTVRLNATDGGSHIKVWEESSKVNQVTLPKDYNPTNLPLTLYVEGVEESDSLRDIEFKLSYQQGSQDICSDIVKATVTPVVTNFLVMTGRVITFMGRLWAVHADTNDIHTPGMGIQAYIETSGANGTAKFIQNVVDFWGNTTYTTNWGSTNAPLHMAFTNGLTTPLLDCDPDPPPFENTFYSITTNVLTGTVLYLDTEDSPMFGYPPDMFDVEEITGLTGFRMYLVWQFDDDTLRTLGSFIWHVDWHAGNVWSGPPTNVSTLVIGTNAMVEAGAFTKTHDKPLKLTGPGANNAGGHWEP